MGNEQLEKQVLAAVEEVYAGSDIDETVVTQQEAVGLVLRGVALYREMLEVEQNKEFTWSQIANLILDTASEAAIEVINLIFDTLAAIGDLTNEAFVDTYDAYEKIEMLSKCISAYLAGENWYIAERGAVEIDIDWVNDQIHALNMNESIELVDVLSEVLKGNVFGDNVGQVQIYHPEDDTVTDWTVAVSRRSLDKVIVDELKAGQRVILRSKDFTSRAVIFDLVEREYNGKTSSALQAYPSTNNYTY